MYASGFQMNLQCLVGALLEVKAVSLQATDRVIGDRNILQIIKVIERIVAHSLQAAKLSTIVVQVNTFQVGLPTIDYSERVVRNSLDLDQIQEYPIDGDHRAERIEQFLYVYMENFRKF